MWTIILLQYNLHNSTKSVLFLPADPQTNPQDIPTFPFFASEQTKLHCTTNIFLKWPSFIVLLMQIALIISVPPLQSWWFQSPKCKYRIVARPYSITLWLQQDVVGMNPDSAGRWNQFVPSQTFIFYPVSTKATSNVFLHAF